MKKIPLHNRRREIVDYAIVDDGDFDSLNQFNWFMKTYPGRTKRYALRWCTFKDGKKKNVQMHRELLSRELEAAGKRLDVDHKNGNGLDNRRENLRVCTRSQNIVNWQQTWGRSKYRGVSFCKWSNKWAAEVRAGGKRVFHCRFGNEEDAARAYDKYARIFYEDFFRPNFPDDDKR